MNFLVQDESISIQGTGSPMIAKALLVASATRQRVTSWELLLRYVARCSGQRGALRLKRQAFSASAPAAGLK